MAVSFATNYFSGIPTSLRLLALALLTGSAFGLVDCKKSREPEPTPPSERELLLTTPKWHLDGYAEEETTAAGVVTTTTIPLTNFDPCSLDDFEYYHADKSFMVDEGTVKCSATYGIAGSGTWAFAANETAFTVALDKSWSYSRHIRSLTTTTMTLASPAITYANGSSVVQIRTYSAH